MPCKLFQSEHVLESNIGKSKILAKEMCLPQSFKNDQGARKEMDSNNKFIEKHWLGTPSHILPHEYP